MRILLVEDDRVLHDVIRSSLEDAGNRLDSAWSLEQATHLWSVQSYDAVVLDLNLPDGNGLAALRSARARGDRSAVLVLTARDRTEERVAGLDAGADDYLGKPFELAELEARVRALIRRSHGHDRNVLVHGALAFDSAARSASVDGVALDLSARELAMLELLLMRSGRVISKEQFVEHLCGFDCDVTANAIEVYVHRLRRKLDPVGFHVQTVRGLGYFVAKPAVV
jgi:DNA-binding response OmpR family regulator